jgi:6-phosphogluconolactonase
MAGVSPQTAQLGGAHLHVEQDEDALADAAARFVAEECRRAVSTRGTFRLALAGGSTPKKTYSRLTRADLGVDWARVAVFFGDERRVPPDDPSSNYRMARAAFLEQAQPSVVHRMLGEVDPAEAVRHYVQALGDAPLDLVLLGMGDDGHVASLFPGGAELTSSDPVVQSRAPIAPHERLSLGLSVINAAHAVALLVTGAGKAKRVRQVFDERRDGSPRLPAARVMPQSGELHWFLDTASASELTPLRPKE